MDLRVDVNSAIRDRRSETTLVPANGMGFVRPDGLTRGRACESVASVNEEAGDVAWRGGDAPSVKKIVTSQVGKGAVNGDSVRAINQTAITFSSMG